MAVTKAQLENWFSYHATKPEQIPKYEAIRNAGMNLAEIILENTLPSADQTDAIRKVRESVATANMAIACNGE